MTYHAPKTEICHQKKMSSGDKNNDDFVSMQNRKKTKYLFKSQKLVGIINSNMVSI